MAQIQTLTFTNKTGLCASKKRVSLTFLVICVFFAIIGICAYQIVKRPKAEKWTPPEPIVDTEFRLPKNVAPFFYKLALIPYLSPDDAYKIDGRAEIHFRCQFSTKKVILHKKNISIVTFPKIDEVTYDVNGNWSIVKEVDVAGQDFDVTNDFYTVKVVDNFEVSKVYRLLIDYRATLNDELVGFYRSSYVDQTSNETRWMGVTQFSPTDARRAFPAFDEPAFKAEFEVSLGRKENMKTLSNMRINRTQPMEGNMTDWVWDHYEKSLPMSTYLVGFGVMDFEYKESDSAELSPTTFKVWARADAINQTDYASEIGPKILKYFEEYFGIEFPMPKLDMIGVPEHRFNAMENWGMITYRELAILFDPDYSSDANKRRIAEVVSHELGHQWFGNLVTPAWWSDLWLKEGFATYMEYLGVNFVEPDWTMLNLFVLNELQTVFKLDALNNSHEISIPVGHPNEINRIFDDISYSKGCSIIRMMDHFLTSSTFKQGITNYLKKWEFNNTNQDDLWNDLTIQAYADGTLIEPFTVADIMNSWTLQKGFPVVTVDRNYKNENETITFTQTKFSLIPEYEQSDQTWHIPISLATPNSDFNETSPKFWLFKNDTRKKRDLEIGIEDWIVVNPQATGYYRVNYDEKNWNLLSGQLLADYSVIHVVNRGQLLDDAMTLARAGLLTYDLAMNLTFYLTNETDFIPWESYFHNARFLMDMFLGSKELGTLKVYITSLIASEYSRIGFDESPENETVLDRSHRIHILDWACELKHSDCIEKAQNLYKLWMTNTPMKNPIPVNLRPVVYCSAIRNGGEAEWEFAQRKYTEVDVASEKDRILSALACSTSETILKRYINDAVTPNSFVRKQDSRNVLQRVAGTSYVGNRLVFQFLQEEWVRVRAYFGAGLSISRLINEGIAPKLKTDEDVFAIEKFRNDYAGQFDSGQKAVDEAVEIVRTNRYWIYKSYQNLVDWLKKQG